MLQCGTVALSSVFCLAKINISRLWPLDLLAKIPCLSLENRLEKYQSLIIVDLCRFKIYPCWKLKEIISLVALKCKFLICLVSLTIVPSNDSQEEAQIGS